MPEGKSKARKDFRAVQVARVRGVYTNHGTRRISSKCFNWVTWNPRPFSKALQPQSKSSR
jgi:hypothetical protein